MFQKELILFTLAALSQAKPEEDRVTSLPDVVDQFRFGMFSGYLDTDEMSFNEQKRLHYLFVESQSNPETDQLVIWFNGGPGCSSLLGFAQEHGPYVMNSGTDYWVENQYSWNREANMLYIEAPAGVGFSYCQGAVRCNDWDDDIVAKNNLAAVLAFFDKFPEFKNNELYITGESYAGMYVPYLTNSIDAYNTANADDDSVFKPNLKGFAVGNGVTNYTYDCSPAYVEMAYWHSLYSEEMYLAIQANNCDFGGMTMPNATPACMDLFNEFQNLVSDVNVYNIHGICYGPYPYPQMYDTAANKFKKVFTAADYTPFLHQKKNDSHKLNMLPPCTFGMPIMDYLNRADVRAALHIPSQIQAWELCTMRINEGYRRNPNGSQWIYEALAGKYRMLHYSGDLDGAVPTLGTQNWIATLDWPVSKKWASYMVDAQVAGYSVEYKNTFTFATVHGAGHMAPQDKRPETYHLIFNWLNGKKI